MPRWSALWHGIGHFTERRTHRNVARGPISHLPIECVYQGIGFILRPTVSPKTVIFSCVCVCIISCLRRGPKADTNGGRPKAQCRHPTRAHSTPETAFSDAQNRQVEKNRSSIFNPSIEYHNETAMMMMMMMMMMTVLLYRAGHCRVRAGPLKGDTFIWASPVFFAERITTSREKASSISNLTPSLSSHTNLPISGRIASFCARLEVRKHAPPDKKCIKKVPLNYRPNGCDDCCVTVTRVLMTQSGAAVGGNGTATIAICVSVCH